MSFSFNQAIVVGNLTRDPELRYTKNGTPVVNFDIATNRSYKDKSTDEWVDVPEYHKVTLWGKGAEILTELCKKGSRIFVQGRNQTDSWEDKNGIKRYTTKIVANQYIILDPKSPNKASKEVDFQEDPRGEENLTEMAEDSGLMEAPEEVEDENYVDTTKDIPF